MDQKTKVWVLAALLALLAMVPFVLQRGNLNKARTENAQLHAQVQQLRRELDDAKSNAVQTASRPEGGASKDQLLELMRLRAEVTALRKFTNSLAGGIPAAVHNALATANPSLESTAEAGPAPVLTTNSAPFNYRGFARPEDTLSTMVWAMNEGRLDLLLSSATPEAQAQIQQEYAGSAEKLKAEATRIVEIKPSPNHPGNENEVFMTMVLHEPGGQVIAEETMQLGDRTIEKGQPYTMGPQMAEALVKLQRVGNEWKFVGKVGKGGLPSLR